MLLLAKSGYHWQPQSICQRASESVARVKQSMNGCLYEIVVGGYGVCMVEDHVSLSQMMVQSTKCF